MTVTESKTQSTASVGKAAASGVVWLMLQSLMGRGVALISQLVLAKLLVPEDFGVLGLAYTVTTIFNVLVNVGIDQVVQQRHKKMRFWATQAFWISLGLATVATFAMCLSAPVGAAFYHNDKIVPLIWLIASSVPLLTLATLPQAQMQAQMKFRFLATYGTFDLVCTQLFIILLAWLGFGALSFAIPIPVMAAIKAAVFWKTAPVPLRALKVSKGWWAIIRRGATVLGSRISATLTNQGDYIILGLLATSHVVGVYYFAFRLSVQPMMMLATNFTNVLFPALTSMKGDVQRQRDAAFKTAKFLGVVTVPICLLQAAVAEPGLVFLFGERWRESIILIQILSIGIPFEVFSWPSFSLLSARGKFSLSFKYRAVSAAAFFALVAVAGSLWSVIGVATAVTFFYAVRPLVICFLMYHREGIRIRTILTAYFLPFFLGAISIGVPYMTTKMPFLDGQYLAQIGVVGVLGSGLYVLSLRLLMPEAYQEVRSRVQGLIYKKISNKNK